MPVLLPRPRLARLEPRTREPAGTVHASDPSLPAQGYRITLPESGDVLVASADAAGRFYAEATLAQLAQSSGGRLPIGEIEDWPDLAVRGVMLDVSRDKVPTPDTLRALVDRLAGWKINQLQLYTEHTFAYADHEDVWAAASPYTAAEMRSLDTYCQERFVELVPNQNCLGHFERWLQHDRYRPLALRPDGFEMLGDHRGPSTLDPRDPAALALVRGLLGELLPNFSSRRVNVGLDEPWELADAGTDDYLSWVRDLRASPVLDDHEMLMWGDIVAGRPALLAALPDGITVCEWGYEADHPFDQRAGALAAAGQTFWCCPGTSSWTSLLGRWTNARGNTHAAVQATIDHGGGGILVADWGDLGHLQPLPVSLPPLAFAAALSWCLEENRELDVAEALDVHAFASVDGGSLGSILLRLGDVHRVLSAQMPNLSMLAAPLYLPRLVLGRGPASGLTAADFERARELLDGEDLALAALAPRGDEGRLIVGELRNSVELACVLADDATARLRDGDGSLESIPAPVRGELARRLGPIIQRHRRFWLIRNREGGLDDSSSRLLRLQACYGSGSTDGVPFYG